MAAKKVAKKPAKGKAVKKSAPKAKPVKAVKKPVKKVSKPVKKVSKPAKKIAKPVKKVSKPVKKVAIKPAKVKAKPAAKKKAPVAKKVVAKKVAKLVKKVVAKKPAPKKVVKKVIAPKPIAKKPAPKKVVKKVIAPKPIAKKSAPKKVVKKVIAPKPVAKKAAPKKITPKKVVEVVAKKVIAKPIAKPIVKAAPAKTIPTANKPAPVDTPKPQPAKIEVAKKQEEIALPPTPASQQIPTTKTIEKKSISMTAVRYADKDLKEFEVLIHEKLKIAKADMDELKKSLSHEGDNSTDDTAPTFKMMEDGSETMNREELSQLASRQEKFIVNLENALLRIKNKTYGICRVTNKLIPKERLRLVPHATLSIEAKNMQ